MKAKIILAFVICFLTLFLISAIVAWYKAAHKPLQSVKEYITVEKIKEVEKIKKVTVPIEKIVTIEKQVLIEKIKTPDWFKNDSDEQATATAVIYPYEGKTNAIATINVKTGVGNIIVKQEPLSFVSLIFEKEIFIKGGYSTTKEMQISGGGRVLFTRIGTIKIGGYIEGKIGFQSDNTKGTQEAAAGVVITY